MDKLTELEILQSFEKLKLHPSDSKINRLNINEALKTYYGHERFQSLNFNPIIDSIIKDDESGDDANINYLEYKHKIIVLAEKLDEKVWTIATSFFLTGTSLGVVVPCMPLLVNQLHITPSQFGLIISSFGLAKVISNIPCTHYVDILGRKPLMIAGLGMCAIGIGGIGASLYPGFGYSWILSCRVVTGIGVSAFVSGSFMYLVDISTSRNRTRTNAPPVAAFNAGLAVGPAIGGVLIEAVGISSAYYLVGGLFAGLALFSQAILTETLNRISPNINNAVPSGKEIRLEDSKGLSDLSKSFSVAYAKWRQLVLENSEVRQVLLLNTSFWVSLAGTQMTLLPLFMVNPLQLTVSQIAMSFGLISMTSFALAQPVAYLSDRFDKMLLSCAGGGLIFVASVIIPMTSTFPELLVTLFPMAVGVTVVNTAPTSHMANICEEVDRSQALSLLRTSGDIGMLLGASLSGAVAALTSIESTMMLNGSVLLASSSFVAWRHIKKRLESS